jgi:hypothetical protein
MAAQTASHADLQTAGHGTVEQCHSDRLTHRTVSLSPQDLHVQEHFRVYCEPVICVLKWHCVMYSLQPSLLVNNICSNHCGIWIGLHGYGKFVLLVID